MEDSEDPDFTSEMGDLMGFSSFGMKPDAKKRKKGHDTPLATQISSTGSNATPIGQKGAHSSQQMHQFAQNSAPQPTAAVPIIPNQNNQAGAVDAPKKERSAFPTGVPMEILDKLDWTELESYRKGVKEANGDIAWFLPSFIEDPWATLLHRKKTGDKESKRTKDGEIVKTNEEIT